MKLYNLCLVGFGNVGRQLLQLLLEHEARLRDDHGIAWRLTGVATRRLGFLAAAGGFDAAALQAGELGRSAAAVLPDVRSWLAAARADVLFEVSSLEVATGQPAIGHLRAALEAGAHAITANKGAVLHAYRELSDLAAARNRRFLFEAACMGGVPVYKLFRETLPLVRLQRLRGILNSTTTVILDEMAAGKDLAEAIRVAQALGVAETDPDEDIDGWDASVKLCALATVLMEAPLRLSDVQRQGIRGLDPGTVQTAARAGSPYRLVCRADLDNGRVTARVRPEQVLPGDDLAGISGTSLRVHFETDILPGLTLTGHNLGPDTTAYDLLADFVTAARQDAHPT